jgi:hypothetical protein
MIGRINPEVKKLELMVQAAEKPQVSAPEPRLSQAVLAQKESVNLSFNI